MPSTASRARACMSTSRRVRCFKAAADGRSLCRCLCRRVGGRHASSTCTARAAAAVVGAKQRRPSDTTKHRASSGPVRSPRVGRRPSFWLSRAADKQPLIGTIGDLWRRNVRRKIGIWNKEVEEAERGSGILVQRPIELGPLRQVPNGLAAVLLVAAIKLTEIRRKVFESGGSWSIGSRVT